ncbi:N-acetylmuramoyl-L-alanine amidase [Phytomonospora sp. NPDC050363]|uniref:golvesin C-terminal-like domain-containing protein n=1 Tax=Phytomonospora sp. NPDC050363 TaxID=3155642 RepID=UPI0033D34047
MRVTPVVRALSVAVATGAILAASFLPAASAGAHDGDGPGDPGGSGLEDPPSALPGAPADPEAAAVDYRSADWAAASAENYTVADRPKDHRIRYVVVHVMQGTYEGTKAWFQNPKAQVTTHYIMRAKDGHVTQMVREKNIAWHAGNWDVNTESIGIEHEGWVNEKKWFTDTVYKSSAKLVRDIAARHKIPLDREHIIGHVEVPGADHTDPGRYWDWNKYMRYLRAGDDDDEDPGVVVDDATEGRVSASANWKTDSMNGQYGKSVRVAGPVASSDPLWFKAKLPSAGSYRVYARYPAAEGNNSKAPYIVHTSGGNVSVYVDQRTGGGQWHSLGVFDFASGDYDAVAVSRWTGGKGRIVADAVRLVKQ